MNARVIKKGIVKRWFALSVMLLVCALPTEAQQYFSLRNNFLYDATLTPNLGAELYLDSVWSVGLNAGLNAWDIDTKTNKKWRHVLISPYTRKFFSRPTDRRWLPSFHQGREHGLESERHALLGT